MPILSRSYNSKTASCLSLCVRRSLSGVLVIIVIILTECFSSILAIGASSPASFVQQASGAAHGDSSSLSLSFPANTQAGDLLLVAFDYAKGATPSAVTDSQGNSFTLVRSPLTAPGGAIRSVYCAKNIKGGPDKVTITLSATSSHLEVHLREYSGINPTNPIEAEAGASGTAGAVSSGAASTTAADDVIDALCVADWACTAGSNFAARSAFSSNRVEDMTERNPGQHTATVTAHFGRVIQAVQQPDLRSPTGAPPISGLPPGYGSPPVFGAPPSSGAPPSPSAPPSPGAPPSPSAAVSLSTTSLTFGSIPVGVTSTPQTVTVTNTGSVALSITGIGLTGADPTDFSEATTCGASLATGGSCTVVVLFTPLTSGDPSASLTVTDDAPDSPQSVSLSGGGSHDVVLTWNDSATPGVLGYNVYRGTASGTESTTPLNSTPIAGNSYADSNVSAGQTYYYVVTALGSNGTTQSADSTEASATVP